jgi:gamma-glutamyl hercynylcysteine S-oxide synthase
MHGRSLTAADEARHGGPETLAAALRASRADTLATFAAYRAARPALNVPQHAELNPPLWELGHIGWFQSWWIARNPECGRGSAANPGAPRAAPLRTGADALYDSTRVAHDSRWALPLPDAEATLADLAAQLDQTLALLGQAPANDTGLYFYRLTLLHEDMHHEAALYMAQALGIPVDDRRWQPRALPAPPGALQLGASSWRLGSDGPGFAFDNELQAHEQPQRAYEIDAQVLRWADYLPFVEATGAAPPRYLRRGGSGWQRWRHGRWETLLLDEPACHLTWHEADAWCRWAERRLPTEAEWERAAIEGRDSFRWGDVWEWTASPFAPYPGFVPHPYREYSAPWFDGRPVLRGASFMTQPRIRHPRYRNYFGADRSDVPAGLRSCAI